MNPDITSNHYKPCPQVHSFYRDCDGRPRGATCNCAVAIRSGDDVIIMDRCFGDGQFGNKIRRNAPLDIQLYLNGELTPGTVVTRLRGGKEIRVTLPTGTVVQVKLHWKFINLYVTASATDYDQTEGRCHLVRYIYYEK